MILLIYLGVFKYYDFFVTNLIDSLSFFGININLRTLHFILPVGISFYTFHGLSYVIDVYNERIKALIDSDLLSRLIGIEAMIDSD